MSFSQDELQEILGIYRAESGEHLEKLSAGLLRLEKEPGAPSVLEEIFREAHSLKGAARMIGFESAERIAHGLEDLFGLARKGELELGGEVFDTIFAAVDALGKITEAWLAAPEGAQPPVDEIVVRLRAVPSGGKPPAPPPSASAAPAPAPGPPPTTPQTTTPPAAGGGAEAPAAGRAADPSVRSVEETIRVTTQKLDDLMNQIGEILVTRIKFDERLTELRALEAVLEDLLRRWSSLRRYQGSPAGRNGEGLQDLGERIGAFQERFQRLAAGFSDDTLRMTLVSGELQESINRVRMMPISALFNLFPRLLRDIARQEGKEVDLVLEGGHAQLDKKIIEELKDPLTHLLRNALDHGVERPAERVAAGKRPAGRLRLAAVEKANAVLIEVEDDGAGMDIDRVRSIALRRGFVTERELVEMTDQQTFALIFRPGFSTKGIITDLSGRGVGLDVVLTNIERMKGTISLASERGVGTVFSIVLPISLATTQALLVRVSGEIFAVPIAGVTTIGEIGLEQVTTVESREAILVDGAPTALVRLHEILGLPEGAARLEEGTRAPIVVLGSTDERVCFLVDELLGEHEIVVKNLGPPLRRVRNVSGSTILGDGSVVLILNVFDLVKSSQKVRGLWLGEKQRAEAVRRERSRVLVVDDSVTTRMLEKNILEGNGYEVTLAVDGMDALEKLATIPFDLVVSDVEMPRMDGFELTRRLRREERHRELPLILVTSLSSEEDRRRGVEAGADAYITKGAFDQGNLIATIRQLL